MKRLALLAVLSAIIAVPAHAYSILDFNRVALGVTAKAAHFQDVRDAFLPDVTMTYSLTSALTLAGSFHRDFASDTNLGCGDAIFKVAGDDAWQAGVSVGVVGYSGRGRMSLGVIEDTSMRYGLRGSWTAVRDAGGRGRLYGVVQAHFDPNQRPDTEGKPTGLLSFVAGLRLPLLGGRPDRIVQGPQ